ncbi:hypothetical protein HNR39_003824 [Glaciimonas immobilis]|uniref:Uncharacterized protein n=1 Tax=Glaciimonas immobilis TaxID=728004 RepID=A0A840RXM5_9BURK|nr:hypothetical protein [Glaciimonas immobilis]
MVKACVALHFIIFVGSKAMRSTPKLHSFLALMLHPPITIVLGIMTAIFVTFLFCVGIILFNETPILLLRLLQWIGRDCVWCTVTPH